MTNKLTLTFDNGPDPEVTPRVLEILARQNVKAHFFVLGKFIAQSWGRALVEREHAEGHVVSNHSYTHETPLGDDGPDAVAREIAATQQLLEPITGARRFRPFGGGGALGPHLLSPAAAEYLRAEQFTCMLWNCVPRDWVEPHAWAPRALAALHELEHEVLVVHDIANASLAALEQFIIDARSLGADFTLELPASCLPIVDGKPTKYLAAIVRQ